MPSQLSSSQKALVAKLSDIIGDNERDSERTAQRLLKTHGWRLDEAANAYFNGGGPGTAASPSPDFQLEKLFDSLKGEDDSKDELGVESSMTYLEKVLGVALDNAELLVAFEVLQVQTVGEIKRSGYVEGWRSTGTPANHRAHASYIRSQVAALSRDEAYFKKVYRHTFVAGKEPNQKAMSLENALVYWELLFNAPGRPWVTRSQDWLSLWVSFLKEKWTRSVNRDMWNMTLEFATKSMQDETLSFWSEDGAWPSVIDDFVAWCRSRGVGKVETMDLDQ